MSHSAISHQIKLLEQHLGLELFIRKARSVALSPAGEQYYPVLREALDAIAEATEKLLAPQRPDVLTVQLYSTFAIRWMIPRLPRFQMSYPDINVRFNTSQQDVDFEQSDVDACVMIGNRYRNDLHYTQLFSCEVFPVCSPSLLQGSDALAKPEDLMRHTILQVYPSKDDWYTWLEANNLSSVNPEAGLQFDSYDHALSTAIQGMGVALGMQPYVAREMDAGLLVEPFPEMRVPHQGDWYFVSRKEKAHQKKVALFRGWLLQQIEEDPDIGSKEAVKPM